jgi:hypothetical protein
MKHAGNMFAAPLKRDADILVGIIEGAELP